MRRHVQALVTAGMSAAVMAAWRGLHAGHSSGYRPWLGVMSTLVDPSLVRRHGQSSRNGRNECGRYGGGAGCCLPHHRHGHEPRLQVRASALMVESRWSITSTKQDSPQAAAMAKHPPGHLGNPR